MSALYLTLLAIYYSISSILLAYVLFLMQAWSSQVVGMATLVNEIVAKTSAGDLDRKKLLTSVTLVQNSFPIWQSAMLSVILVAIAVLAFCMSNRISQVSLIYTFSPMIMILVIHALALLMSRLNGTKVIRHLKSQLN